MLRRAHWRLLKIFELGLGLGSQRSQKKEKPGHSEERTRTGKYIDGAYSLNRMQAARAGWGQCVAVLWSAPIARKRST